MATKKSPITDIQPAPEGDHYIVTRCDDTTYILPCISCGGSGDNPPTPPEPPVPPVGNKDRCAMVTQIAKIIQDKYKGVVSYACPNYSADPQQISQGKSNLQRGMTEEQVALSYRGAIWAWADSFNQNTWYLQCDAYVFVGDYSILSNIIECCLSETYELDQAFFECIWSNMDGGLLLDLTEEQGAISYFSMLKQYMQIFPLSYWQNLIIERLTDFGNTPEADCEYFIDCETAEGCPPDAIYSNYSVDWQGGLVNGKNFEWDSIPLGYTTVESCYGAGAYDPCAGGANARRGQQFYLSTEEGCLRGIAFSFAGNGKSYSTSVRVYVNEELYGSYTSLVQKTRCINAGGVSPYSFQTTINPPIANVTSVRLEFFDFTGSEPAFGQDLHCLHLNMSID